MKRFLALFAVLVLCISLFAACKKPNTPDNDPTNPTIGEEEATLADAAAYLNSLYKDGAEATERDYDVVGKVMIGTTVFEVTWTVDVDSIKIVKSAKEGFWTVDLPSKADEEIPYTLTATIKDAAGNTETRTFKRKVPVMDNSLLVSDPQEGVAYKFFMKQASIGLTLFATGEMDGEKYLASTTDAKAAPDFFVEKSGNGVKIYTEVNGKKLYVNAYTVTGDDGKVSKYLTYAESTDSVWTYDAEVNAWCTTIGKTEYVVGTYSTYKTFCISEKSYISTANTGVSQFPAGFADKAAAEALDPNAGITIYKTPAEIVKAAYALEVGKVLSAGYQYTLTGVITKVNSAYNPSYGNVTVTIVVDGMTEYPIECYRLKGDGADKIKKGDTITVKGELFKYDNGTDEGKVEFNAGCVLVSYEATGAAEQKFENAEIKPVKPVAGKAYKVVYVQENLKSTAYFMTGTMSGYYGETTTVEAEAADVYVETTTGGYYIYAMVGGKKVYVGTVKSADGAHINFTLGGEKTVYTWNEDKMTMVATIDDVTYAFGGTYSTHSSISPQDISKNGFIAHFVVQGTTTGTTVEEEIPDAPEATDTFKEGVAYKMFMVAKGGVTYYALGTAQNDKFIETTDKVKDAVDFYLEKSGDGFKIYYKNGSKKVYLDASTTTKDGKTSKFLSFKDSTNSVFTYDKSVGAWFTTVDGAKYGIGTYGDFTTVSMSDASYYTPDKIGSQYVLQFVESAKAPTGDEDDEDDKPTYTTNEEILKAAYALEIGGTLGEYTMTGVITSVDDPYSTQYKNVTVTMVVDGLTNYPIVVFRAKGDGADVIKVGDTITVTGTIIKYDDTKYGGTGKVEFSPVTLDSYVAGGDVTPDNPNPDVPDDDTAPVEENVAYKLYINQVTANKEVYATHTISGGKYIATTTDAATGVDFYAEKVTGGWKFYTTIDGAKMYLHSWLEGNSKYIGYAAESDVVYVYDAAVKAWCTTISETDYFVGTYNTFDTVSLSGKSYINASNTGVTQFPAEFVTVGAGEGGGDVGGGDEGGEDDTPTYTTPEEILKAAYALENGATLGNYTLTGVITSVDDPYSTQFNNVTVTMVVDGLTDYPIVAFRLKGTGADTIKVGDTITVTGSIMKYTDGTVEFNSGCTLDAVIPGTTPDEGGDEGGEDVGGGEATGAQIVFDFGANGSGHNDGSDLGASKTYTVDGYSLALTLTKVYGPAYDAAGNSCIKLGTSSKTGALSFTVADDVTSVVIKVAKYKSNTTKISVNGTAYTLTKNSNDGEYDEITVDTSSVKTVNFETVSGGVRCMINEIVFVVGNGGNANPPADGGEGDEGGEDVEVPATLAEQLAAAAQLENDTYLPYESTITGVITNDPQASSYNAGQYRFNVSDGTNTVTCYYVPVTGGTPKKGDTVTVTGKLTAYNGSAQFDDTAAATWVSAAPDEGGDEGGEDVGGGEATGAQIVFDFGANGSGHNDGSDLGASKTYTVDGYSLALTLTKVYGPAYDAAGNSCIKLGTSSKTGALSFTVADDVTSVVIKVAKYKSNTTKISVNGTAYTLTKNSNDGEYDEITVDTSSVKTVNFETVSGGVRCMINEIVFVIG